MSEDSPPELIMDLSPLKNEDEAIKRLLLEAYGNLKEN